MMNQCVIQILLSVFIIKHLSTFCLWSFLSCIKFIVVLLSDFFPFPFPLFPQYSIDFLIFTNKHSNK